ncbi:MAG: phosphoribosyl-ATP diphosphatase [Pseudomonadota bacterium]
MTEPTPLGDIERLAAILSRLAETIDQRASAENSASYTAKLLSSGPHAIAKKVIEEGGELALALTGESDTAVASEAADVLYHMLVGLKARGISLDAVARVLEKRQGTSGLEEKARRKPT